MDETQKAECNKNVKEFLFVGAPLLDVIAHCSQETLDRYGLKLDDCIRETERQEDLFRMLLNNRDIQKSAGGSSQNSARIAKWTLGDRGRVSFAGCIGKDNYGVAMSECLQSEAVEALYITLPSESTGVCACLIDDQGDRSMISRLGAAQYIAESHMQEESIRRNVRRADCIYVEGYVFGHSPDVILALAKTCSDKQLFSVGVSAEYVCRNYASTLLRVLNRVDVLFSNETEAKVLAQSLGLGHHSTSVEDIAQMLAVKERPSQSQPRIVVVTRGPNPVLVARGTDPVRSFPVPRTKVLDGVGCGDALAGAFLAVYVVTGGDVFQATQTGISAAVEIAQVTGCRLTKKKLFPLDK